MVSLHEGLKRQATAAALRYAGARMSTVGRRVVLSGRRVPVGEPMHRAVDVPAREVLREERRPVGFPSMRTLRQAIRDEHAARPHWSEVDG